ncbi:MAG: phenylalanine--tRNA ligase subunit beta [Actinomycetota bacterium]|nr:phenylalanine--tRNA ligase subunit beta [Actinomycetota bacterium]
MRVPFTWLREFAPTDLGAEQLAEILIPRGVNIETIEHPWEGLDGVVVVRVLEVRDHPNSDKLCVARIQHGSGEAELVVGVRNMAPSDLVPWAPPGARVPVLPEPLTTRRIRGVDSNGMLCSPRELAISQDHGGILILTESGLGVGDDLKRGLGLDEAVLDIEVEPNRPDFLSVFGVAREAAAATGVKLVPVDTSVDEVPDATADAVTVRIDDLGGCPRYIARAVRGVTHRPSPLGVQARLTACGVRPIDAVVDATNYTMLEIGQPLHAFDMHRLAGPGIVVRKASDDERLLTLDDVERTLTRDDLLICDVEKPVALAGVMGGRTSEVSEETTDVLLESACFTRSGVLLTARRLDLHTEASHRFERGSDPEACPGAAARCAALMMRWAGGEVMRGVAEDGRAPERKWVALRPARATALLGYPVPTEAAVSVFDTLGMTTRLDGDRLEVEIPGFRTDIEREVDLIEEVVRIQGYDNVGSTMPRAPHPGGVPDTYAFVRRVKGALARAGLREIRPVPFDAASDLALFGDTDAIPVTNPLRAEEGFLRARLTPGLLHAVALNQSRGVETVRIFEVGTTFRLADPFVEIRKAGFALCGGPGEGWWSERRALDVLDAKGVLESLLGELGVADWSLADAPDGPFHPGRSARIVIDGSHAGVLGEIHPRVAEALDITGRVSVGVVGLRALQSGAGSRSAPTDVPPRFPPVHRDLAFIVEDATPAGAVHEALRRAGGALLASSTLFDVYAGDPLPAGMKSLAFSLDLRAPDRTLRDEEAQEAVDKIVEELERAFGAKLRTG